jgi:quinol monooxygenase YgiN
MPDLFGLHVRFKANPGMADELERVLLEAAAEAGGASECRMYVVGRSPGDEEVVWVIEAWTSREAHDASLKDPAARALIQRAMPLLAGRPQASEIKPSGGKGL